VLLVINVDGFTLQGSGSFTGFLFDEHQGPQPAGGNSFNMANVTNVLVEGVTISHFEGSMWIHFSQHIMVRNVTLFNRNLPEETGNIEVGGMGSHGMPPPLCAYKTGRFNPADPCLVPGANWQYELNLLRPTSNFTMRDSTVNGGDDNVCIKNDTDGVRGFLTVAVAVTMLASAPRPAPPFIGACACACVRVRGRACACLHARVRACKYAHPFQLCDRAALLQAPV